jgi:hypothetical protein
MSAFLQNFNVEPPHILLKSPPMDYTFSTNAAGNSIGAIQPSGQNNARMTEQETNICEYYGRGQRES